LIEASLIEALFASVFGLVIGSFLNVCIHRWPRNRSVVKPRSHCVRCRKPIAWYDNIPVLSYLILRGRCRHCGKHISWRYPLVELLTGALFFTVVLEMGVADQAHLAAALKICVFSAILVALVFSDLEKRLLPDELTIGGTLIGLAFAIVAPVSDLPTQMLFSLVGLELTGRPLSLAASASGAFWPAFFLWSAGWLYGKIRHREGLGFGDVKLVAMIGSFLGLQAALLTLILGSVSGSLIGYSYIKLTGKDAATYELPFGSFLGAAALVVALKPALFGL
jgi:leader peptidase (prepilin peptidase)/N-methyltransferase